MNVATPTPRLRVCRAAAAAAAGLVLALPAASAGAAPAPAHGPPNAPTGPAGHDGGWTVSNALLRTQAFESNELRRKLFEREAALAREDDECRRLAGEIAALQARLEVCQTALQDRVSQDAEWLRLRDELGRSIRTMEGTRRAALAAMRAATPAYTNRPQRELLPTRRPPPLGVAGGAP